MDEDFFDADDFDGTDDDFVDPLADDGDCLDEGCPDEDGEDSWDEEAELAEAFETDQDKDPATDAPARSEKVKSGFDALDALILGTMVAGVASDGTRPARRGKRGPNRT
ncbi:hypothetical protein [uncultured Desulfobulbus sp.]|uniref:hypothetical protein n=1 Tax=uncultured Desulfobulbus sp. TaxID=239745 RepID=UPI00261638C7|nr:hypothetical protein [uncultured Desulfobulbus sp.]